MPTLIERLEAKRDWFAGKYRIEDKGAPPYENTHDLLNEAIAKLKEKEAVNVQPV